MIIKELLTSWKNDLFQLLFPIRCVVCERETENSRKNRLICTDCLKNLSPSLDFYCPLCEAKTADGKICYSCSSLGYKSHLDTLIYPFSYKDKPIQKIIKTFKYHFIKGLSEPIGKLLAGYLNKVSKRIDLEDPVMVPVPLHRLKYNQRGYNQTELIAGEMSKSLNLETTAGCLIKSRKTKDQASLDNDKRVKNLAGAFKCLKPRLISGKKILLIDDVYTTGATMQECARVLKEAGAGEIIGFVIARG